MIFNKFPNAKITLNDIIDKPIQQNKTELRIYKIFYCIRTNTSCYADKFDCIISHRPDSFIPNYKDTLDEKFLD